MLQQTTVAAVIPYFERWLRRFPDFATLAAASELDVLHAWQGLGYYARARNLHATAKIVATNYGGVLPESVELTRKLPGLGRYTANAVATFAFDQSVPIVEANTARTLSRLTNLQLMIDSAAGQSRLWEIATALVPKRAAGIYNSALTDLGALICISGNPRCDICPVRAFCRAINPATLPRKKTRTPTIQLTEHHGFTFRNGRILLEQSPVRWRGMWMLPRLAAPPNGNHPLHSAEFPFTHHRITLQVHAVPYQAAVQSHKWFRVEELAAIPIPSPHRRALDHLLLNSSTSPRMTRKVQPCVR
jgi:A/G-specific adenine glycosylase